jgi:hypothetical protein
VSNRYALSPYLPHAFWAAASDTRSDNDKTRLLQNLRIYELHESFIIFTFHLSPDLVDSSSGLDDPNHWPVKPGIVILPISRKTPSVDIAIASTSNSINEQI